MGEVRVVHVAVPARPAAVPVVPVLAEALAAVTEALRGFVRAGVLRGPGGEAR